MLPILSLVGAVLVTAGFLFLVFRRTAQDKNPPDNGGTPQVLSVPAPNSEANNRTLAKRRTTLTAGVAAAVAQRIRTFDPRPRLVIPTRLRRNKKAIRRMRKVEREARRRMYELRRLAA